MVERMPSAAIESIDMDKCYFNPGCAMSLYKPELPDMMLGLLREHFGSVKMHRVCCHHDPGLPAGSVIINNCAGCDRLFRKLYAGISTITYWEVLDSLPGLELPDYGGLAVSVHDSCSFRCKPQVHEAVRSLLGKMNLHVVESGFSREKSICCGDNLYGHVPAERVEQFQRMRAAQMPCRDVVVTCISCIRSMTVGGKQPRYLPDLIFGRGTPLMHDTLEGYHDSLDAYIAAH